VRAALLKYCDSLSDSKGAYDGLWASDLSLIDFEE
jgi:hypothetical protein